MKKPLLFITLGAALITALIVAAQYLDLVGAIKRMHGA
jgi:hypothetical protein